MFNLSKAISLSTRCISWLICLLRWRETGQHRVMWGATTPSRLSLTKQTYMRIVSLLTSEDIAVLPYAISTISQSSSQKAALVRGYLCVLFLCYRLGPVQDMSTPLLSHQINISDETLNTHLWAVKFKRACKCILQEWLHLKITFKSTYSRQL